MRVAELTAFHVRIPLKWTVRHASHTRQSTDSLVIRCRLDDGTTGWGEGLPRTYVTGESIETAWELLRQADLRRFFGDPLGGVDDAIDACGQFELPAGPPEARDSFGNSVRCAIELSVLDAACRAEGVPLSAVAARVPETLAIRELSDTVRYSAVLTSAGKFRQAAMALGARWLGFEQLKVKVGVPGADDVAMLARVRRFAGRRMDVRIDANEAWRCDELEQRLAALADLDLTAVEQPVPHAEVDGLAAIRPRLPIPVMLDESLCSLSDARRAIERGLCDLFNIRLSKCGGYLRSLKLAALAHRAGLGYQLGCQVGETGILSAAGRHFAGSVGGLRYLEGSYDRHLVRERLTVEDLTFASGGLAHPLAGPGLGVEIDPAALRRVTIAEFIARSG